MDVLCFDVASGGVSGARFDESLNIRAHAESPWKITGLTGQDIQNTFHRVAEALHIATTPVAAIAVASFMHGYLVVDSAGNPVQPAFTWLDTGEATGVAAIQRQLGDAFHERTGCRYHPMFPVFKLATSKIEPDQYVVSPKSWLVWTLTGKWTEDFGMASASGLLNIHDAEWDAEILRLANVNAASLPAVSDRESIVGSFHKSPVINGSGDGFMATLGSGCESAARVAVTLGTTASARSIINAPILAASSGTFCYRANSSTYLFGCAGNNGGNALNWARQMLGPFTAEPPASSIPIFLPMLHGERSPDWNAFLHASWHDVTDTTKIEGLRQSVLEGVVFNLAHYTEILESTSGVAAKQIVLSGNGFLEPQAGRILAAIVKPEVLMPASFGMATMRGSAVSAWRAVGHDPKPAVDALLAEAVRVKPVRDEGLSERFARYKQLRGRASER